MRVHGMVPMYYSVLYVCSKKHRASVIKNNVSVLKKHHINFLE